MKVAYYEENNFHTEIIGTFLNFFSNNNIKITVYNSSDRSSTLSYFQKISHFELKPHNELVNDHHIYDKIIIGTAGSTKDFLDKVENIDYDKIVPVCHFQVDNTLSTMYKNILVLTPLNIVPNNKFIKYILPIHNYYNEILLDKRNILTIVGRFKNGNRNTNDLINVVTKYHNLNFMVNLFARAKKFVPPTLFALEKKYSNKIKIYLNSSTEELDKYLKESKFILPLVGKNSWYYRDRLSGCIALAYNYNIPLVIDEKLRNIYRINACCSYQNSLCEVIEEISNMDKDKYYKLVIDVINDKNKIVENNNNVLKEIFKII